MFIETTVLVFSQSAPGFEGCSVSSFTALQLVDRDAFWRYFAGDWLIPTEWKELDFDDQKWSLKRSPFSLASTDVLFLRHAFEVSPRESSHLGGSRGLGAGSASLAAASRGRHFLSQRHRSRAVQHGIQFPRLGRRLPRVPLFPPAHRGGFLLVSAQRDQSARRGGASTCILRFLRRVLRFHFSHRNRNETPDSTVPRDSCLHGCMNSRGNEW